MTSQTINNTAAFIWSVADLLRGDYKQSEYGKVILPLTVLRRIDCVLEPTKAKVLERAAKLPDSLENRAPVLAGASGKPVFVGAPKGSGPDAGQEFWVRIGNATKQLHGDDLVEYTDDHWG